MTTSYCINCGGVLEQGDQFCRNCGAAVTPPAVEPGVPGQTCSNCGVEIDPERSFCDSCKQVFFAAKGVKVAEMGRRMLAFVLDIVLIIVTLVVGYLIWWLFTLRRGQTPAKQLLGLRVIRTDGRPSEWGWTFTREFIFKVVLIYILGSSLIFFIVSVVNLTWAFWDKNRQALHDKVMKTLVVDEREFRAQMASQEPTGF